MKSKVTWQTDMALVYRLGSLTDGHGFEVLKKLFSQTLPGGRGNVFSIASNTKSFWSRNWKPLPYSTDPTGRSASTEGPGSWLAGCAILGLVPSEISHFT